MGLLAARLGLPPRGLRILRNQTPISPTHGTVGYNAPPRAFNATRISQQRSKRQSLTCLGNVSRCQELIDAIAPFDTAIYRHVTTQFAKVYAAEHDQAARQVALSTLVSPRSRADHQALMAVHARIAARVLEGHDRAKHAPK